MNKHHRSAIPDENKVEELLTKIQPVPSKQFHEKMEQVSWWVRQGGSGRIVQNSFRVKAAFAMIVLVIIASLIATPQVRAWAQEAVRFFIRINSATVQLSDEQMKWMNKTNEKFDLPLVPVFIPTVSSEMAAISGCETPQKSQSYRCQVALAESTLGFDLKELPEKPNDWELRSIYINTDSQYAVMSFDLDFKDIGFASHSRLMFTQGVGDFSNVNRNENNPWRAVPADKVEPVSIGVYKGEYVKGAFSLKPGNDTLVWSEDSGEHRLVWSEGTRWYLIEFWPNLNVAGTMGKDQLIYLAESLVVSSIETTEPLNPDRLLSISDAEKVSELDLKAPTLLPMDIDFSYARYFPDEQQVHLIYGPNEELIIYEWKGNPINYKKPLDAYGFTCEIVNMNGEDAYYCFFEGPKPRSFLWWHKDGLNYQMYYYDKFLGGQVDREKMISIAESIQDIDDFRKKSGRNYEEVVIYEQALRIDVKKFPEATAGWVFDYFWSDAYTQCIDLTYKAIPGQDTLSISQCKTDKRSDISLFPFWSIKRVKVGSTKGYYIVGNYVMTEDGKQVWDPTSPRKQLYWQEDGLWMQIALYGDEALLSDKEDLISYAESLR